MIICKQCKQCKDDDQFLWRGKRGRIKARFCFDCGRSNMVLYERTAMVGRKPEEFSDARD